MQHSYRSAAIELLSSPLYMTKKEANNILNSLHIQLEVQKYTPKTLSLATDFNITTDYSSEQHSEDNSIALYYIDGCISWDSWWWHSTKQLIHDLIAADNNDNILAHFMIINSSGGEAFGMNEAYETIAALKKPIVAVTEKIMASAAYNIGCGCTKLYAINQFSEIGSIGIMCQYTDWSEYYKKLGINEVEIYATESTHKNKYHHDVKEGKSQEFITQVMDPLFATFREQVLRARPGIAAHEDKHVLNGQIFYASDAIGYNLIDGIMSIEDALEECYELGKENQTIGIQTNIINQYKTQE